MARLSLTSRFTLFVAAVLILSTAVLATVNIVANQQALRERFLADLAFYADHIADMGHEQIQNGMIPEFSATLHHMKQSEGFDYVHVIGASGMKIIDPSAESGFQPYPVDDPMADAALLSARRDVKMDAEGIHLAVPIIADNTVLAVLRIGVPDDALRSSLLTLVMRNVAFALAFLLVAVPLAAGVMRHATRPIRDLTNAVQAAGQGNLSVAVETDCDDEIGALAASFGSMATSLRTSMARIHQLAFVDSVTGLANRQLFRSALEVVLSERSAAGTVLFIDLDNFKKVNDSFGHDRGDALLAAFADRLKAYFDITPATTISPALDDPKSINDKTIVARIGGDEFTVLLNGVTDADAAMSAGRAVHALLAEPFDVAGISIVLGASIGIAQFPDHGRDAATVLRHADIAMYQAKASGRNRLFFYAPTMEARAFGSLMIENGIREALANGEFLLHYQPKMICGRSTVAGVEGLIRWNHPERGLLMPNEFIPVAENTGMIRDIGNWVVAEACRQAAEWCKEGLTLPIAVNVSMAQLECVGFVDDVIGLLDDSGIEPELLEIEITETLAMTAAETLPRSVAPLKQMGVRFAIDDFGTGHSSLSALSQMPFDVFKIDRSFIDGIGRSYEAEIVIRTILAMASSLGYETVAEGVETERQEAFLASRGCTLVQGYLFAPPMEPQAVAEFALSSRDSEPRALQRRLKGAFATTAA